jgi:hypothetical protein
MQTIANQIYPSQFESLFALAAAIEANQPERSDALMASYRNALSSIGASPERLQAELFLDALQLRLSPSPTVSNLYLLPDDENAQISLFNLMAEQFPVVRLAQWIANTAILDAIGTSERAVILDMGMGTGQQMASLLNLARERNLPLKAVTIIGIEPSENSFVKARERFESIAWPGGPDIEFVGIPKMLEAVDAGDWQLIADKANACNGVLAINASFALHHTRPIAWRAEFFKQLAALKPVAVLLIEPYGDYTTDDLTARFQHAWHHYGLTFRALDSAPVPPEKTGELKRVFFGREILDVMAAENRIEQYETAEMWLSRLKANGFHPLRLPMLQESLPSSTMEFRSRPEYASFDVNGFPIVAIIGVS